MIECTINTAEQIATHTANTVGFENKYSPNYAGKERRHSGVMLGGWTTRVWIGDREVSTHTERLHIHI